MCERKTVEQSIEITQRFFESTGRAILSRVPPELEKRLADRIRGSGRDRVVARASRRRPAPARQPAATERRARGRALGRDV